MQCGGFFSISVLSGRSLGSVSDWLFRGFDLKVPCFGLQHFFPCRITDMSEWAPWRWAHVDVDWLGVIVSHDKLDKLRDCDGVGQIWGLAVRTDFRTGSDLSILGTVFL